MQLSHRLNERFGLPPALTMNQVGVGPALGRGRARRHLECQASMLADRGRRSASWDPCRAIQRHSAPAACCWPPHLQRDVPGLTRAAIPILARQGVRALTVGVNGVSAPPAVPFNTPFWWRDEPSGTQLLSFWHPGEAGLAFGCLFTLLCCKRRRVPDEQGSLPPCPYAPAAQSFPAANRRQQRCARCAVLCHHLPAGGYSGDPVDRRDQCVHAPGHRTRLCLSWTHDNSGPPPLSRVLANFARVRSLGPAPDSLARPQLMAATRQLS